MVRLEDSYDAYEDVEEPFQARLDESLDPRGPDALWEIVASLDLRSGGRALDVGCGGGEDAAELAGRFGLHVLGVDPTARQAERTRDAGVPAARARAESLPVADACADFVWSKEALMYADVDAAFREFARVLKPGAVGFLYQVLTGPRMTEDEAREFWPMGGPARSYRAVDIEAAIAGAGLELRARIDFASEWGEYGQERSGAAGRRLLHTARLLRDRDRYVAEFGEANYSIMLGDCLWHVYRLIGKLHGAAFVFARP